MNLEHPVILDCSEDEFTSKVNFLDYVQSKGWTITVKNCTNGYVAELHGTKQAWADYGEADIDIFKGIAATKLESIEALARKCSKNYHTPHAKTYFGVYVRSGPIYYFPEFL